MEYVKVIGAGLAGSEAAWQIAQRGIPVKLYEMRPAKMTPAHQTGDFAELVCSNSLRANNIENAVGLLKEEIRYLDSLIMACADRHRVPAGGALAVDRLAFQKEVTQKITTHPLIEVIHEEVSTLPDENELTILATGPLTSKNLMEELRRFIDVEFLYFFDAAAPIIDGESIDYEKVFWGSRYNKGDADYLNCPMTKEEYESFYGALISAEVHPLYDFEKEVYFEGCMPVEVMASRGMQTLLFGPLKPVGLIPPNTEKRPFAVVQLRRDNAAGTLFNMVGFQTHLKWGEQKRVFRMIPGLEKAEFARFGVMHKNTYLNSPHLLLETTQLKRRENLLIAGQVSGVEGYVESAASGLVAGINGSLIYQQKQPVIFPRNTAIGSLLYYITHTEAEYFQPMNITFGLIEPWPERIKDKKEKNRRIAKRALLELKEWAPKALI